MRVSLAKTAVLAVFAVVLTAEAMDPTYDPPSTIQVPLVTDKPKLDGKLSDPFWQKAGKLSPFRALIGDTGDTWPKTEAMMATTKDTLYMAFRCHERDMEGLRAEKLPHDSGKAWDGDTLEIFLRSSGDPDEPFHHFVINAAGSIDDWYFRKFLWDGKKIKIAASEEKSAWILEIAIPFSELHLPSDKTALAGGWGLNIFRTRPTHKGDKNIPGVRKLDAHGKPYHEETVWSPPEVAAYHARRKCGYAYLEVFGGKAPAPAKTP